MMSMKIMLLAILGLHMASAVTVPATTSQTTSYGVGTGGFCYEATQTSGATGTVKFGTSTPASLVVGTPVRHLEAPNWGASYSLNVTLTAGSSDLGVTVFTSGVNPCDPNPCSYQNLCVPQPGCLYQCQAAPTYSCATSNPCTEANINAGNYFFASSAGGHNYLQCSGVGACHNKACPGSLYWSQYSLTCVWW